MKKNGIALAIILIILMMTLVACGENDFDTCEHNVVVDEAVSATCTEMGLTEGKHCSKCGEVLLAQTEVPATGHSPAPEVKENESTPTTCVDVGSYESVVYCSVCDTELSREITYFYDVTGHTPSEPVIENVVEPTCIKAGSYDIVVYCESCNEELSRVSNTSTIGHDYKEVGVTEPTCTEKGYTTYTCHCGDEYVADEVDAIGHSPADVVVENSIEATCTTAGSYDNVMYCSVCEVEVSRQTITIEALDHDLNYYEAKEPTCIDFGWEAYESCTRCDHTTYVEIPATGHNHNFVVTEPTCTAGGYTTYTCHCGDTYDSDYVSALGHDTENHDGKASTCTEIGWIDYETCSRCDYTTYAEIPARGHSYSTHIITTPTCTEQGYTTHTCSKCGDFYVDSFVEATGHNEENYVVKTPTCTEVGREIVMCSRCNYSIDQVIPATGHSPSTSQKVEPTCTEQGYTAHICSVCGESYADNFVDSLGGHVFNNGLCFCGTCIDIDDSH